LNVRVHIRTCLAFWPCHTQAKLWLAAGFFLLASLLKAQATLPLSRTTWSATPTGWTDNAMGTYTSTLTCDGNSNRGRMDATGDYTQVFFTGTPVQLSFDLQGNTIGATSSLLVEESANGTAWTSVANISGISGACVTYTYNLACATTQYVRWTYTKVSGNLAIDNVSITTGGCAGPGSVCPSLTGAVLNSCDNGTAGCNEGDAEILFMNTGTYSLSVSCLPANLVNYYGSSTSYTTPSIDAYTGTFSSNTTATGTLNGSTGCSGNFIDASTAGTIPAGATVMMVPSTFCSSNYDFSTLCSSFSPIYVLYFSTAGWSSSGNLANQQSPAPKPKYLTLNMSAASEGCPMEYYTYDANSEASGNGASVSFNTVSTASATPANPSSYTTAGCTLPLVLPADLLSFGAQRLSRAEAKLEFVTVNETNLKQFTLSRSIDAITYMPVATLLPHNTAATHTYTVYDGFAELAEPLYYRLEEEDMNGGRKIIGHAVLGQKPSGDVEVFYNYDEVIVRSKEAMHELQLFSAEGKKLLTLLPEENTTEAAIDLQKFAKGFYLLQVADLFGNLKSIKLVR
jgi:hypothetical protein